MLLRLLKDKLAKLVVLLGIGLIMAGTKAVTKLLLLWFGYEEARRETLSTTIGNYTGAAVLLIAIVVVLVVKARQPKQAESPALPTTPPPPPRPLAGELPQEPAGRVPPRYDEVA